MQHRTYDWFKSIRKLSPKQPHRCIQIYDCHDHPLNPNYELEQIVQCFSTQFSDPDFRPYELAPLEALPFDLADVQEQLKRLPATKSLGTTLPTSHSVEASSS